MDKPKKSNSPWWIGLTYAITASVPAALVAYTVGFGIASVFAIPQEALLVNAVIVEILYLILLWPCIWSAARYVRKTYEYPNAIEIVLWGLVFSGSSSAWTTPLSEPQIDFTSPFVYIYFVVAIVTFVAFYKLSKKYLVG